MKDNEIEALPVSARKLITTESKFSIINKNQPKNTALDPKPGCSCTKGQLHR